MRSSNTSLSPFVHEDPDMHVLLAELADKEDLLSPVELLSHDSATAPAATESCTNNHVGPSVFHPTESFDDPPDLKGADGHYHVVAANLRAGLPPLTGLDLDDQDLVEIYDTSVDPKYALGGSTWLTPKANCDGAAWLPFTPFL